MDAMKRGGNYVYINMSEIVNSLEICRETHRFAKEYDIRLDISPAPFAFGDLLLQDVVLHLVIVVWRFTVDAMIRRKASMRLYDFIIGHTRLSLECIDVLGEAGVEEAFFCQQTDERMGDGWSKLARV